jgi:hypothetical protein
LLKNIKSILFTYQAGTFIVKRPDVSEKAAERRVKEIEEDLAQEVLQLKKRQRGLKSEPEVGKRKMSLEKRMLIADEVARLHRLTGIALLTLVVFAGVSKRTWREWQERSGQEARHNGQSPAMADAGRGSGDTWLLWRADKYRISAIMLRNA